MSLNFAFAVILLGGWLSSRLFSYLKLPGPLGMVAFGVLAGAFFKDSVPPVLWTVEPSLKSFALVVILLRAGLGLSKSDLRKAGPAAVLMAVVPCVFEGAALSVAFRFLFGFPWEVSGLTGFMLAAVSPAVVVPSMLDLQEKGYGRRNAVATVILAGASADDVIAITFFSAFLGMAASGSGGLGSSLLTIPVSIVVGVVPGAVLGALLVRYFRARYERVRATEKTLVLLAASLFLVQLGDWTGGAALLGVMTMGFMLLEGSERAAHELSSKLKKAWIFAEIVLFVLVGMAVDVPVALGAGLRGAAAIGIGLAARSAGVLVATLPSKFTWKEKLFCVVAYVPKATVQAALGGVALQRGLPEGPVILAIAVLSIVLTAPLGLFGIRLLGKRLLDADLSDPPAAI